MPTEKKISKVAEIKEKFDNANAILLADYRGLTVKEISTLRRSLRQTDSEVKVYKNTLMRIAAQELGYEDFLPLLEGPNAVVIASDPVGCAKEITAFAKEHAVLELKGGLLEKKAISAEDVKSLAKLPSREQLLAMFMGTAQAPITSLARTMKAPIQALAIALNQLAEQKQAAGQ